MGVDEVRSLPWWQKRVYLEGLAVEYGDDEADEVIDASTPEGLAAAGLGFSVGTVSAA
jgi:hypothetical protein